MHEVGKKCVCLGVVSDGVQKLVECVALLLRDVVALHLGRVGAGAVADLLLLQNFARKTAHDALRVRVAEV